MRQSRRRFAITKKASRFFRLAGYSSGWRDFAMRRPLRISSVNFLASLRGFRAACGSR
jgi:hypothetical protein